MPKEQSLSNGLGLDKSGIPVFEIPYPGVSGMDLNIIADRIFEEIGAVRVLNDMAQAEAGKPMGIIAVRAIDLGKEEAIMIPLFAQMSGYGRDIPQVTAWMQVFWTIVREVDNTIDFHDFEGSGAESLSKRVGHADALEISLAALFGLVNNLSARKLENPTLIDAMSEMGTSVYTADFEKRNLAWDRETRAVDWKNYAYERYLETNIDIARIFSWFARLAFGEMKYPEDTIRKFEGIAEKIGLLRLVLNDIEDISSEVEGKYGNDVGLGPTAPWAALHRFLADDGATDNLEAMESTFDRIGRKRRGLQKLTARDTGSIKHIVEIGRRYLPRIANSLSEELTKDYESAKKDLEEAPSFIPKNENGELDERNRFSLQVLDSYLDNIWEKIRSYENYQFRPKIPEFSLRDKARIIRKMKALGGRIASLELQKGRILPRNCPCVLFDNISKCFIVGDVFFNYRSDGKFEHQYRDIKGSPDKIWMGNLIANTIIFINENHLRLPLLADKASIKALQTLKGNKVDSLEDDPFHYRLETPVGGIDVYLPNTSVKFFDTSNEK